MAETRVLLICGSRKPAPGRESPSAARTMLHAVGAGLESTGADIELLDVRDLDVPLFDGRSHEDYGSPDLERLAATVARSEVVVLSVPAYWGGASGVVKNLLDLLGGAAYDAKPDRALPLAGKIVALVVVGADDVSAHQALSAMRVTIGEMGGWTAPRAVVVGNPRRLRDPGALLAELKDFGVYAAGLTHEEAVPAG